MFTGIIEELGSVVALHGKALSIHCHLVQEDLMIGDSIAVNGVCLTIINYSSQHIEAEVMPITLETTNLGSLKPGFMVNLERAIRLGGRWNGNHSEIATEARCSSGDNGNSTKARSLRYLEGIHCSGWHQSYRCRAFRQPGDRLACGTYEKTYHIRGQAGRSHRQY
mgnify:CR=1 FL=1